MSFRKFEKEMKKKREEAQVLSALRSAVDTWTKRRDEYTEGAKAALRKGNESSARMQITLLRNAMFQLAQSEDMLANFLAARDMRDMQTLSARFVRSVNSVMKDVYKISKSVNFAQSGRVFDKSVRAQTDANRSLRELLKSNGQAFSDSVSSLSGTEEEDIRAALLREVRREEGSLGDSLAELEKEFGTEQKEEEPARLAEAEGAPQPPEQEPAEEPEEEPEERAPRKKKAAPAQSAEDIDTAVYFGYSGKEYVFPPLDLLKDHDNAAATKENESAVEGVIAALEQKLREFGIAAKTESYLIGPAFTRIELRPEPSVQISKIAALKDDIAMALKRKVRLLLPIEGKDLIGVEVENAARAIVPLKRMFTDPREGEPDAQYLEAGLGFDPEYRPQFRTFNSFPHLLVGGTTGSGKSCFLHALLTGMFFRYTPAQLRLVLIDFKRVEMGVYNGLPFVVGGRAVDEYDDALRSLELLDKEMERRYTLFSSAGVRNIAEYNAGYEPALPMILVAIDEYADIASSTYAKQFDRLVQRLAQKARACGIHLVISTQRPSVKVINGIIKANFPARAAFAVASYVDSMNILDTTGAECLLGSGDMLFSGGRHTDRLQAPYVSTEEIAAVADFIKENNK